MAPGRSRSAISALQASPTYTSALQSGQNAILANASATGGLRGGNVQSSLAQFSPALLAQTIQNQYANLGSLTNTGTSAASSLGAAQLGTASSIAQLLQQQGAATAGGQLMPEPIDYTSAFANLRCRRQHRRAASRRRDARASAGRSKQQQQAAQAQQQQQKQVVQSLVTTRTPRPTTMPRRLVLVPQLSAQIQAGVGC
jgi:hypothetical protein